MKEEKSHQKSITVDGVKNVASNPVAGNMASEVELRVIEDMKKSRIYFEVGEEKKSTEERKLDEKKDSNSRKVAETDWKSKMKMLIQIILLAIPNTGKRKCVSRSN